MMDSCHELLSGRQAPDFGRRGCGPGSELTSRRLEPRERGKPRVSRRDLKQWKDAAFGVRRTARKGRPREEQTIQTVQAVGSVGTKRFLHNRRARSSRLRSGRWRADVCGVSQEANESEHQLRLVPARERSGAAGERTATSSRLRSRREGRESLATLRETRGRLPQLRLGGGHSSEAAIVAMKTRIQVNAWPGRHKRSW